MTLLVLRQIKSSPIRFTSTCISRSFTKTSSTSFVTLQQNAYRKKLHNSINSQFISKSCTRWKHTQKSENPPPPPPPPSEKNEMSSLTTKELAKSFSIGSLAGILGSLVGMGGGFVMIPLMTSRSILGSSISQHVAHGTSLFAVAATGIAGALAYSQNNSVDITSAIAITSCAMVSVRLGAKTTSKLSERTLKQALGAFMICVAPLVPAKTYLSQWKEEKEVGSDAAVVGGGDDNSASEYLTSLPIRKILACSSIGIGSGFLSGLFGVGGGAIVVPALTVFTDMDHYTALGTSLCAMTLPAVVGTVTHSQRGNVNFRIAPMLALGSFVGAFIGGNIGLEIEEEKLRWGFSGFMATLGLRTLIKA